MAWVKPVEEQEAGGRLKELYEWIKGSKGRLGNLYTVRGLFPETVRPQFEIYRALMFGRRGINRVEREMIALVVSTENRCHY